MHSKDIADLTPPSQVKVIAERVSDQIEQALKRCGPHEDVEAWVSTPRGAMKVQAVGFHSHFLMVVDALDGMGMKCRLLVPPEGFELVIGTVTKSPDGPRRAIGFLGDVDKTT